MPAADEVWRLQRGTDPDCRFFQKLANQGHYRSVFGTRQGIYVCSPGGDLLASINSLNADEVISTLEKGLRGWRALVKSARRLPADIKPSPDHRWESSHPPEGLVLTSANCELSIDDDMARRKGERWNIDHAWFTKEEARAWIPHDPQVGVTHHVPQLSIVRLARFHLVDNVRGQTLPFAREEIGEAHLQTEVIERHGSLVRLRITGQTDAATDGSWRMQDNDWKPSQSSTWAVTTRLHGFATYDLDIDAYIEFEMAAVGTWRGHTENNARRGGPESGRLGFVFTLAGYEAADRVPPAFINVYNADWLTKPAREQ